VLVSMAALVTLLAQIGIHGGDVLGREVTLALINLVIVLGLFVFVGSSGVASFCHIGFAAVGAYVAALLVLDPVLKQAAMPHLPGFLSTAHLGTAPALAAGALAAAAVSLVVSLPLMRMSGLPASLATFAILMIIYVVASNWTAVTGGPTGLGGMPTDLTTGQALICALVALTAAYVFHISPVGLRLRASREDELGARSVGIGIHRERRIAFAISASMCGLAGGLYAVFLGSFTADNFFLTLTFITIVMMVVGGIGTLSGAVIGTAVVQAWSSLLSHAENGMTLVGVHVRVPSGLSELGLAVMMLAILLVRPRGLVGGREVPWPFRSRRMLAPSTDAVDAAPREPVTSGTGSG
jgi:branched-chain amino acid transport system permease protein